MRKLKLSFYFFTAMLIAGCSGDAVEVIDLNKVLDVMVTTLDQTQTRMGAGSTSEVDEATKSRNLAEFNTLFTDNLNQAKIYSQPLATTENGDASFSGFVDKNQNRVRDSGEEQIFLVEIDYERSRLIATDTVNGYHRDHGFSMAGFATGMLLGHLLSRQRAAGVNTSRFSSMKMSPPNYHAAAVSSAKARSGSGSYRSGK